MAVEPGLRPADRLEQVLPGHGQGVNQVYLAAAPYLLSPVHRLQSLPDAAA